MNSNINEILSGKTSEIRKEFQEELIKRHVWQTCLNCEHWGSKIIPAHVTLTTAVSEPLCKKFDAMPPPSIIATGCKDHELTIPF